MLSVPYSVKEVLAGIHSRLVQDFRDISSSLGGFSPVNISLTCSAFLRGFVGDRDCLCRR